MTQQEAADFLLTTREAVSKWELGRAIPRAEILLRLAVEVGQKPAKLLQEFERGKRD